MNHRANSLGGKAFPTFGALLLSGASVAFAACGSSEKVVAGPEPAKMVWNSTESSEASGESASTSESTGDEAAPATSTREKTADPAPAEPEADPSEGVAGAIDLDALAAAKEAERAAPAEPEAESAEPAPAADPVAAELQRRRSEKARRMAKGKKATSRKAAAAPSSTESAARAYTGSDPCRASSFSLPRVREACDNGGRPAAKRVMKDAIGKATATGQMLKCSDCHSNQRNYALKSNAVDDLKRWLDK